MRLRIAFLFPLAIACGLLQTAAFSQGSAPLTGGPAAPESEDSSVLVRTILIRPKECPTELSSRLLPSQDQLTKGTAAPIFLRMNWEATHRIKVLRELYFDQKLDTPLDEWDPSTIDSTFPINLDEMSRAVFRERAGWEYPLDEEPLYAILLPDVQESRLYVHAMLLKARSLIKQGKTEDAERVLCLAIGLAKHVGETPFIISRLVQYAQTNNATSVIEELLQHPQAPNYYWDIASLPRPFIDVRSAIQLEGALFTKSIAELNDLESLKTREQWEALATKIFEVQSLWSASTGNTALPKPGTPEAARAQADWEALSRQRLPKIAPELAPRLDEMCDAEVGVRYWWLRVQARTKSHLALALLEPQFAIARTIADIDRLSRDADDEMRVKLASPMGANFIGAAALLEQKFVMLRAIESIRDFAASHDGKLPRSLSELRLPVPNDPVSGQALEYEASADGMTARLAGATIEAPLGWNIMLADPANRLVRGMRYELKIAER